MEAADQCGHNMAVGRVVVVVGAVEVCGHDRDIVRAVLAVEELAVFETADFGEGVSLVRLFQFGSQQAAFLHRLRGHARIDAGRAEELQLFAAVLPGGVDDVHLERHVEPHEISQRLLIGDDAADLGCGEEHVLGLFLGKEPFDILLTAEVKLLVGAGDDIAVALALQLTHDSAAHHAAVPGNVDFCIFVHHNKLPSFEQII